MPAFTAIGIAVASAITGATFATVGAALTAGAFGFAAIATISTIGAAYITSRIINGNVNKGSNAAAGISEGGRVQLPPASNHKIPVLYGSAFANGIITDARITDENKTMYYCLVLSETTQSGSYTVNDVYANDLRLIFEGAGSKHKVAAGRKYVENDPATQSEDFETSYKVDSTNLIEVRVYAGSGASTNQIFPTADTPVNAWDYWNNGSGWTSANEMKGLVFAIVKVRYNADKGLTGVPNFTFDITNTLSNPAAVWRDYMTSVRYGAQVDGASIPTGAGSSYARWRDYCDELIRYTNKDAVSSTQKRYTINGVLDTSRQVKTNIDSILQNGGAWMSYDVSTGYWRPVIKKAVTAEFTASRAGNVLTVTAFAEGRLEAGTTVYDNTGASIGKIVSQNALSAGQTTGQRGVYIMDTSGSISSQAMTAINGDEIALEFNDENILGGITISSTSLDDLYNAYEAEFFDKHNKDQRAYSIDQLDPADKNPNEPDNSLRLSLEFTNNSPQAEMLANIELRQSRDDLVIEFTASHYGIQAQAGDVVAVVNSIYGWNPKYFRVMRVKEVETEEGGLIAQIQALEYNGDVYTHDETLQEFTTEKNIGIIPFQTTGTDSSRFRTPDDDRVSVVDKNEGDAVPSITIAVKIPNTGGPYDETQVWYATGPTAVSPNNNAYTLLQIHKPPPPDVIFDLGRTVTISSITSNTITSVAHGLENGDQLYFYGSSIYGFTQNKIYYVLNKTADTFQISLTEGGSAVLLTTVSGISLGIDTCHAIKITGLPANTAGQKYYFKVRVCGRNVCSAFTNPDSAVVADPTTEFDPDPGAGSQEVLNIKEAILKLDFGKCVLPNNGFWVWKTMTQIDFGSLATASPYQLDLGLIAVTENTVTAATDIEEFVWQVDPE